MKGREGGEAGGRGSRQALPQAPSDKQGFCRQDFWGQSPSEDRELAILGLSDDTHSPCTKVLRMVEGGSQLRSRISGCNLGNTSARKQEPCPQHLWFRKNTSPESEFKTMEGNHRQGWRTVLEHFPCPLSSVHPSASSANTRVETEVLTVTNGTQRPGRWDMEPSSLPIQHPLVNIFIPVPRGSGGEPAFSVFITINLLLRCIPTQGQVLWVNIKLVTMGQSQGTRDHS